MHTVWKNGTLFIVELNKIRLYQLQKQNLIQMADASDYPELLKEHIGLHSTDYLTPYLSLWARIENFEPKILFNDLNEHRNALRIRAFRGTLFIVHTDNLKDILDGSKHFLASRIAEAQKYGSKIGTDLNSLEKKVVGLLLNNNFLTISQIKKELAKQLNGNQFLILQRYLEFKNILARTSQRYITDQMIRYGLMEEWIPDFAFNELNSEEAIINLISKYIKIFGPVCLDDLCWWFPLSKTIAKQKLENVKQNLIVFDLNNREYMMAIDDFHQFEEFKPPKDNEPIVNFLPYEDHFPKAYSIRNWFLSEEISPLVYKKGTIYRGQIFPSIWLNGEIIGNWELEWVDKAKSAMKVEITNIYEKLHLSSKITQLIKRQRRELENFVNEKLVPLTSK